MRLLPRDCVDGVELIAGEHWVPASTVVFEEWVEDENEGRGGAIGGKLPGNAAGGGRLMNDWGDVGLAYM